MTAPEAQETANEVARAVERVTAMAAFFTAETDPYNEHAADLRLILSRLSVLEEERRLDWEFGLDAVFNHVGPEDEVWVQGMTPQEIGDLTAFGWEDQVETLMRDADSLDRMGQPGTGGRVRFAAKFIGQALAVRTARLQARTPSAQDDQMVTGGEGRG